MKYFLSSAAGRCQGKVPFSSPRRYSQEVISCATARPWPVVMNLEGEQANGLGTSPRALWSRIMSLYKIKIESLKMKLLPDLPGEKPADFQVSLLTESPQRIAVGRKLSC